MFKQLRRGAEEGFTLIELLIVIVILGILAAIVVFAVGTTGTNAAVASCKADAKTVETALEAYKAQNNSSYPGANDWTALTGTTGSGAPFLRQKPTSTHYAINFDASGHVSADASGVSAYTSSNDFDTASSPCSAAS